jgi:shikimate dehydrogenase
VPHLPAGSMIVNATGMGKDRPGSPLPPDTLFPRDGIVWDLNYRGELAFLHHARAQAHDRRLRLFDGWLYFLHGWCEHMAEVFDREVTPELFGEFRRVSDEWRAAS